MEVEVSMLAKVKTYFAGHPTGFWFIFWGEFAERCSYYGMRAILALYMVDRLGISQADASTYMHFFIAACYFLPLLGGFVADRFLGKYWTIVGFSVPYVMGHLILGVEDFWYMLVALGLLAMGSGVIKPNISTLMGLTYDQQRPGQTQLRSDAFAIFYFAINFGAGISQLAMPWLRTNYGYAIAFMFPAALMVFALGAFAAGKRFYAKETVGYVPKSDEERAERWRVLGRIAGLFLLIAFFWSIFDQSASTWIFYARASMNLDFFGHPIDPDQVQAFNALFIIALLPFIQLFWNYLINRGIHVRATDKIIAGFLITAACMGVMALSAYLAGAATLTGQAGAYEWSVADADKVTIWWQILAYLLLTVAEIFISVTGLELAYTAAPKSMTGFVTGCWLFTVFAGDLMTAYIARLYVAMQPVLYFSMLTVLMLVVAVAFVFVARRFNRKEAARLSGKAEPAMSVS
jgi:POT family proton-dependent oligopeptide transporter